MITSFFYKVPFVSVPHEILPDIVKTLDLKEGSTFYDLGSGDGRILFYISEHIPKVNVIGIENNPFPLLFSRIQLWWRNIWKNNDISILFKDFFLCDISNATHIFTYLYPNVMDDLLPKFDRELKPGTKVISISFKFTQKQPIAEIDIKRGKYRLARKLYVYEF